jgi:hypothetical protein
VVRAADQGTSVLPPWLQVVAAVAAIGGTLLGAWALYLRWRDKRPRLRIHTTSESTPPKGDSGFKFTVKNHGAVDVKIGGVLLILAQPGKSDRVVDAAEAVKATVSALQLPCTLEARDAVPFFIPLWVIEGEANRSGYRPHLFVIPVVVDGLGLRHEGTPWYLIFDERPRREREATPPELPLSKWRVDWWRWKRRLSNWRQII